MKIPMSRPDITALERAAVSKVLETDHLSNGPYTSEFEEAFAAMVGRDHAVSVSSGTAGLHLCMIGTGIEQGDLVVTSPFSFVASANIMLYERAIPVFVDVDHLTGNLDVDQLEQALEDLCDRRDPDRWLPRRVRNHDAPKVRAILPVHVFGQPASMVRIEKLAERFDLHLVEDACEALGATHAGREAGTFGESAVFAFYPNKQITTGEGGMVVTDDGDLANLFRSLRNQGRDVFDAWLNHSRLGFNYRMDEMSAALGLAQISRLDEILEKRARVATWYNQQLGGLPGLTIPQLDPETTEMSWFVYVIRLEDSTSRAETMEALEAKGIPTRPYFQPIHLQPFYRERFGYERGDFPVAEQLGDSCLALPFSGVMTEDQVSHVCNELRGVLG